MNLTGSWRIRKPAQDEETVYISEKFGVRTLHIGSDTVQSSMRLSKPNDLEVSYTRSMMGFLLFNPHPRSVLLIGLALVWMLFVNRFSGMQRSAPLMTGLGCTAIALEVIWRAALVFNPVIGRLITVPQVSVWLVFLLALVIRGIKALLKEPFVTTSVLLGAASGYLTIHVPLDAYTKGQLILNKDRDLQIKGVEQTNRAPRACIIYELSDGSRRYTPGCP